MHIRPFHAVYPDQDYITSSDSFFKGIKENYPAYRSSLKKHMKTKHLKCS